MKNFNSLGEFADHLLMLAVKDAVILHGALERAAVVIEKKAKAEFGVYQAATGPFPAWAELAESTKEDRLSQGYSENDPLLRSGATRDTISHKTQGLEAEIGSTDEKMPWLEFGTSKMPPRPVLGPAAHDSKKAVESLIGAALVSGLINGGVVHPSLGYDFETKDGK